MILRVEPFQQPDLKRRHFNPDKARAWTEEFGVPFPYRKGDLIYVLMDEHWALAWKELVDGQVRRYRIVLPRGWVTDLSSVPRLVRWIVDRVDMGEAAPLVHDTPYRFKGGPLPAGWIQVWASGAWKDAMRTFPRALTDQLFRKIQERDQVRGFVRWASWLGVRANFLANWGWSG